MISSQTMHLNHESKLIKDCYPSSKLLLSLAPDFKPASQELSRLTYTASNKPGRLNKLGEELEKRAKKESAKAGYNLRSRASFLVTLYILKALCTECRRDLALFSSSVIRCVDYALDVQVTGEAGKQSDGRDLEILARAGSVFSAFLTFTTGDQLDDTITSLYLRVLKKFADLATSSTSTGDPETRIRGRLIGIAAISSAATSDALYASGQYKEQINIIVPALLACFYKTDVAALEEQCEGSSDGSSRTGLSPYFTDTLPNRPPLEKRRAQSIHAHVDGEKGPSNSEVSTAAVRTFRALCGMASGVQVSILVSEPVVDFLDALDSKGTRSWADMSSWCCWLATSLCAWTQLQYRFVVLSTLVETLVDTSDTPAKGRSATKPLTLVRMISTLLNSKMTLIGVATSETQASLLSLVLRRVKLDARDPILPLLVEAIGALGGKHLYYGDQVGDQVEELAGRIGSVLASAGGAGDGDDSDPRQVSTRNETLRVLLASLGSVLSVATDKPTPPPNSSIPGTPAGDLPAPSIRTNLSTTGPVATEKKAPKAEPSSAVRTRVTPEALQETIPLIVSTDYALRASYAAVVTHFLSHEIEATPLGAPTSTAAGLSSLKVLPDSSRPGAAPLSNNLPGGVDASLMRFLNALNAAIFTLLLSPHLGRLASRFQASPSSSPSSPPSESVTDASAIRSSPDDRRLSTHTGGASRAQSTMLHLLPALHPHAPITASPPALPAAATLSDFANVQAVLVAALRRLAIPSVLATVPMLLALETELHNSEAALPTDRILVCEELLAALWSAIGETWIDGWANDPDNVATPSGGVIPAASLPRIDVLEAEAKPVSFGEASRSEHLRSPKVDRSGLVVALASSRRLQEGAWLDKDALHRKLTKGWSVETALVDSVEQLSTLDVRPDSHDSPHLMNKISNVLMHIDNASLQSFARGGPGSNGKSVGVGELREALGGRSSLSVTNLNNPSTTRTPSISTIATAPGTNPLAARSGAAPSLPAGGKSTLGGRRTLNGAEVSDVFRKLGIGKEGKVGSGSGSGMGSGLGAGGARKQSRFAVPATKDGARGGEVEGVTLGPTVN